ncbi:MAG: SMP-30/gluconolactonase/LRE family protein [Draconibacterium sp.]|nr:SMP-30/gluconolactonase/LRE family protein [Draconibacterium sp.]
MKFYLILFFASLYAISSAQKVKKEASFLVSDSRFTEIIPSNTKVEILAEGFEWTEGPLWLESENKLIFSEIPSNTIYEWTEQGGTKVWVKPSGYTSKKKRGGEVGSNGLLLSPEGELILCQHGDRRVARMKAPLSSPVAKYETLANRFNNKKLNSPNDAAYHKNGDLYFTDPPYGLETRMEDPKKELDFQGVYRLDKGGKLTLLTKELSRPNGIAFSPDYKKLYVANSDPQKAIWKVYELNEEGLLENGKIFHDATPRVPNSKGLPDGLKVHPDGWIFATGPGGVFIFSPGGTHLGTIQTGEATSNCAFNTDYSFLFMTADDYVLRMRLK